MNDPLLNMYLSGMVTAGFLAGGLFFVRSWVRSRDSLFLTFAGAFWLLALNEMLVALVQEGEGSQSWVYLPRVAAFLLIAVAIVCKNAGDAEDD